MKRLIHTYTGTLRYAGAVLLLSMLLAGCRKDGAVPVPLSPADGREHVHFDVRMGSDTKAAPDSAARIALEGEAGRAGTVLFFSEGPTELVMGEEPLTKAAPVTEVSTHGTIQLYGYDYASWSGSATPNWMSGEKVSYDSSDWVSAGLYNGKVASGRKLRFYGFAPYGASGVSVPASPAGALAFSYTTPSAVSSQKDLLVGSSAEITGAISPVTLNFSHALTAVTFRTGTATVSGTVKSISVKGISTKGTYTIGSGWSNQGTAGNITATINSAVTEGVGKNLTSDATTMMLIPQTVPAGAYIEAVVNSEGSDHTLTAPIAGNVWKEGYSYVYSLSFDSIAGMHISASPASVSVSYGADGYVTVTGDPADQNWTFTTSGSGFTAEKVDAGSLRITGTNFTGTDSSGSVTITTEDGRRSVTVSVTSVSLQESLSVTPTAVTVNHGGTATLTLSGVFPGGVTEVSCPAGITWSLSGNKITLTNNTTSYTQATGTFKVKTTLMGKPGPDVTVTIKPKAETIAISPKSATVAKNGTQAFTVSGGFLGYTASLSDNTYASVSTSGNTVTVTNKNTTYANKTVTLTVKTTGDTKASASTDTNGVTLTCQDDYVTGYSIGALTLSTASVGAGGGNVTWSGASVTRHWASGRTDADYATASVSCSPAASYNSSTKTFTIPSAGTNPDSGASFTITASYSSGGLSATNVTKTVSRSANAKTLSGVSAGITSNNVPWGYVNQYDWMAASGGKFTLSATASYSYSSGGTSSESVTGSATFAIKTKGMGESISGNVVTVPSRGTTYGENAYSTYTATYGGKTGSVDAGLQYNHVERTNEGADDASTRYGDITYSDKSYGALYYDSKSYGSNYVRSTDYTSWVDGAPSGRYNEDVRKTDPVVGLVDVRELPSYSSTGNGIHVVDDTRKYIVLAGIWRSPHDYVGWSGSYNSGYNPLTVKGSWFRASHTETRVYQQKITSTRTATDHYYRDWTRAHSYRDYTRTAYQMCKWAHHYTETYTSGSTTGDQTVTKYGTDSWTDTGTDTFAGDSGTEFVTDSNRTETSDRYVDASDAPASVSDPVYIVSAPSWWGSMTGQISSSSTGTASSNNNSSRRSATMVIRNNNFPATTANVTVVQAGGPVSITVSGLDDSDLDYFLAAPVYENYYTDDGRGGEYSPLMSGSGMTRTATVELGCYVTIDYVSSFTVNNKNTYLPYEWIQVTSSGMTLRVNH